MGAEEEITETRFRRRVLDHSLQVALQEERYWFIYVRFPLFFSLFF
jgi:hypothetical protein